MECKRWGVKGGGIKGGGIKGGGIKGGGGGHYIFYECDQFHDYGVEMESVYQYCLILKVKVHT